MIPCSPVGQKHFSEVFGETASLTRWLRQQVERAQRDGEVFAEASLESGSGMLFARIESLLCDDE